MLKTRATFLLHPCAELGGAGRVAARSGEHRPHGGIFGCLAKRSQMTCRITSQNDAGKARILTALLIQFGNEQGQTLLNPWVQRVVLIAAATMSACQRV